MAERPRTPEDAPDVTLVPPEAQAPIPPPPVAAAEPEPQPGPVFDIPSATHSMPNAAARAVHQANRAIQAERQGLITVEAPHGGSTVAVVTASIPDPSSGTAFAPAPAGQGDESRYSRADLLASAAGFGMQAEIVIGALAHSGKSELTRSELDQAIAEFLRKAI